MRKSLLSVLLLVVAGCTWLGVEQVKRAPQTPLEALYMAASTGLGLTLQVNDLYASGLITKEQHDRSIAQLQKSRDAIAIGLDAVRGCGIPGASCNPSQGQTRLDQAEIILRDIAALLAMVERTKNQPHAVLKVIVVPERIYA